MSEVLRRLARIAGLIAGPGSWGLSTQAAYSVASQACATQRALLTPTLLALIAIAAAGALVSALAVRGAGGAWFDARGGAAGRLLAGVSCGAGLLFALVIANQYAAMLILPRCLR